MSAALQASFDSVPVGFFVDRARSRMTEKLRFGLSLILALASPFADDLKAKCLAF
jgi:hypothetical protein